MHSFWEHQHKLKTVLKVSYLYCFKKINGTLFSVRMDICVCAMQLFCGRYTWYWGKQWRYFPSELLRSLIYLVANVVQINQHKTMFVPNAQDQIVPVLVHHRFCPWVDLLCPHIIMIYIFLKFKLAILAFKPSVFSYLWCLDLSSAPKLLF